MTRQWWTLATVSAANALTSAGFAIAGLATAAGSAKMYAMYAAARALPLAAATVWLIGRRSSRALVAIAVVLGLVQACDGFVGLSMHDMGRTVGPFVLALATFASVMSLSRS